MCACSAAEITEACIPSFQFPSFIKFPKNAFLNCFMIYELLLVTYQSNLNKSADFHYSQICVSGLGGLYGYTLNSVHMSNKIIKV